MTKTLPFFRFLKVGVSPKKFNNENPTQLNPTLNSTTHVLFRFKGVVAPFHEETAAVSRQGHGIQSQSRWEDYAGAPAVFEHVRRQPLAVHRDREAHKSFRVRPQESAPV